MTLPKWAKYAIAGAIIAVTMDYFVKPTINKNIGL